MNRDTILLLALSLALAIVLAGLGVVVYDAVVLNPPDADTTLRVTGAIQ